MNTSLVGGTFDGKNLCHEQAQHLAVYGGEDVKYPVVDVSPMGYHVVDPHDIEITSGRPSEMHYVSETIGLTRMGLRLYHVAPGEDIPLSGLHYHDKQEEAFYVVEGELSVETPEQDYRVNAGKFFIVEPGNPHRAYNDAEATADATVIGIGAPPVSDAHAYEE